MNRVEESMRKKSIVCAFLTTLVLLAISFVPAKAQAKNEHEPKIVFILNQNSTDSYFTAKLVLENIDLLQSEHEYILAFNSIRPIFSVENAELLKPKQGGDFYMLKFTLPKKSKNIIFNIKGQFVINKYTDAPSGYFLIDNANKPSHNIVSVNNETILPHWQPAPGEDEASKNKRKENTPIEGNPIDTVFTSDTSLIVPLPVELQRSSDQFILNQQTRILYQDKSMKPAAVFFAKAIEQATGYQLNVKEYSVNQPIQNVIFLTNQGIDSLNEQQRKEGYILEIKSSHVIVRALTNAGFFYGLQSLRQLLPPEIFSHQLQQSIEWKIPGVFIRDYPRFEYRGLHLDVARHFIPVKEVKRLIDLMAVHKLNYFEWHLTDDEGWRIEIKHYPELTNIGAWRGYRSNYAEHDLLPAYGSGANPYGGFYTQDDIRDIVHYADERHITIIPEIDMPGHARAMMMSMPNKLIDPDDQSIYTSVQGYHDNVLSPCKAETFTVLENILTEVSQLFPGKYIHIGGDEVPRGAWKNSCMAKKYNSADPKFEELVQNEFFQRVQTILQRKGKMMAGWEEVASENGTLAAPLRVYVWNKNKLDQVYKTSVRHGYEIIMAPAENLYFDLAYSADPHETGQYWAGYVDTFSAYSLKPINVQKGHDESVIKGVQGELWSEVIASPDHLDYLAFPKVAGLAELAWTPASRRNWKNFYARMREKHLIRLHHYGVRYRQIEFSNP